ncbi:hypothetical protein RB195_018742 [Necator americanus]|uniref:Endonuclease/exonuclease/phosphatase domain-containing protein n=1 Tax=Necator americanus TaxID=51031 RepID=A0ABR1CB26_NECAM
MRNIPQSDVRKSRAVRDIAFDSDHRPVLLNLNIRFHKRNRGILSQPKIDMASLKDDKCRTNFRQHLSIYVGEWTRKKLCDADSFTKCIRDAARETLPVQMLRRKFSSASAETRRTYNSVCAARSTVLNTASRVAVGEGTLPIWRDHFKTLLNRRALSVAQLEHVDRPTDAVNQPFSAFPIEPAFSTRSALTGYQESSFTCLITWINERPLQFEHQPDRKPFEVVTGVRQGTTARPCSTSLSMRSCEEEVEECPADIVLAQSECSLTDLENADDVIIFAESSTKLQHIVNLVCNLESGCSPWTTSPA